MLQRLKVVAAPPPASQNVPRHWQSCASQLLHVSDLIPFFSKILIELKLIQLKLITIKILKIQLVSFIEYSFTFFKKFADCNVTPTTSFEYAN